MIEEKDPETILEERRRKRAEIMAKFQAQGRKEKPVAVDSAVGSPAPDAGGESVTSGGTRTGLNTASGELPNKSDLLCMRADHQALHHY